MILFDTLKEQVQSSEFLSLCLGECLGEGVSRKVYNFTLNDIYVAKVETDTAFNVKQNLLEWDFWQQNVDNKSVTDWLAPVVAISACGTFLIQRKVTPIPHDYQLPTHLPAFLNDIKVQNFGLLDGKFVCVDYGMYRVIPNTKMKSVEW